MSNVWAQTLFSFLNQHCYVVNRAWSIEIIYKGVVKHTLESFSTPLGSSLASDCIYFHAYKAIHTHTHTFNLKHLLFSMCVFMCVPQSCGGQRAAYGVDSLLPLYQIQGLNSGHQSWPLYLLSHPSCPKVHYFNCNLLWILLFHGDFSFVVLLLCQMVVVYLRSSWKELELV